METLWFCIVAFMLAMYVVLDGFDLGAGILHLILGRTDDKRRLILRTIAPVWDGNEVWLLAAGGTLYFAFPALYASSFSGFYLPLMIVLWLLMLRGAGIEFRHQVHHPMWSAFWDVLFSGASILLAIFFGAALGNVVRGVPLNAEGWFFEPLWTTFTIVPQAGILDWFTVIMGLVALCALSSHGARYVAMKTDGEMRDKARKAAAAAWWGIVMTSVAAFAATLLIRPQTWDNYTAHPWGYLFPLLGIAGLAWMPLSSRRGKDVQSFLASAAFIGGMLAATAFALFPVMLPSSTDPSYALTVYNSAAPQYGLNVGLVWWIFGMVLAAGYFFFLYRAFRGKTTLAEEGSY